MEEKSSLRFKKDKETEGGVRRKKEKMVEAGEDYRKRKSITKERHNCDKLWQSYGTSSGMAPALTTQ